MGAAIGLAITFAAIYSLGLDSDGAVALLLVTTTAICICVSQWLLVRQQAARAVWWIGATRAGVLLGAACIGCIAWLANTTLGADAMSKVMQGPLSMALPLTVHGAAVGFAQWLFLRTQTLHSETELWIAASAMGAGLFGAFIGASFGSISEAVLAGAIPAIATGFVWAMLVKQGSTLKTSRP
jgi:hypothetical protein